MKHVFTFILLTLISCTETKQLQSKWIGKSIDEVKLEMGEPNTVLTDSAGIKTIVFYKYFVGTKTIKYNSQEHIDIQNGVKRKPDKKLFFYIDSTNKVYKYFEE
jgi:hypothetical protein